ncbi:MAG TPA: alcohol dehydrogenase catalytic domain-containing protein [Oculatellaceae cyanobacterium]
MLAVQIQEDYRLGVSEMPTPTLPPRGAIIRVSGCGLCGSDLDKVVHRKSPPGQVLGHEVVGVIEALAEGSPAGWAVGDRLVTAHHVPCLKCHYCLNDSQSMCRQFKSTNLTPGGFAERIALTEGHLQHTAFKIPASISTEEASCVEPLACVLRAVKRSENGRILNGTQTVVIVGLGFIGMLAAQIYKSAGYAVIGLDLDRSRLALARTEGFVTEALHPIEDQQALGVALEQVSAVGLADLAFLTVVSPSVIRQALSLLRDGGTLLAFASGVDTAIDPSVLYFREINLVTSYSPSLTDLQQAAELIFNQKINVRPLITHTVPLSGINQAFELYRSGKALKVFVSMEEHHESC